ncbi:V-type ATPase subunit [Streptococcus pseudoporcinus]|uniref:V-type H+-transporting ATPase subunit C n=1 Tax=Streptococcus pseudoporcinus TaxID=361101 RepID=A0A4U9XH27_9STRE|nr:V-type ATPase subunit [Streptococcus pseudoporcinus]VTS12370.1 V-type H+-transporting ATPase subunit C [Streptococcus pseudoporcinus]VUC64896.1 V-type H+-transporting ATPase subunit C [Streptococcus pseudoporcinus]VUC95393.1 V-type H+-transporting ATPase subunit C [Streptococcus pseudoporcinus]VUC95784.1 V-type H+-transporting ATPase subunit C [Streptococcus pseudoporcinus]
MDHEQFSQLNTSISVKEKDFISQQEFMMLINARNKEELSLLLQKTPYPVSVTDLDNLDTVEKVLMQELGRTFKWVWAECPIPEIVDLFILPYLYHNVKVLLKAKASQKNLDHLLIPFGGTSLPALQHLVRTLKSDYFPDYFEEEIQSIWEEYMDYGDSRVIEIGADLAYFKHLRRIAEQLDDPLFDKAVDILTDSYNVLTLMRAKNVNKSDSFIKQLLTEQSHLSYQELTAGPIYQILRTWYSQLLPENYSSVLVSYEKKIANGELSIRELEELVDLLIFYLFDDSKFTCQGPYPVARFLLAKLFEIKNLRLILSAKVNQLPLDLVKERLRPFYDY